MRGSKPGERRGGRARGTPNKRTLFLEERLEELNCDPIGYMAKVMMDEEAHPQVRLLCREGTSPVHRREAQGHRGHGPRR